jgi:hypothetical protein
MLRRRVFGLTIWHNHAPASDNHQQWQPEVWGQRGVAGVLQRLRAQLLCHSILPQGMRIFLLREPKNNPKKLMLLIFY